MQAALADYISWSKTRLNIYFLIVNLEKNNNPWLVWNVSLFEKLRIIIKHLNRKKIFFGWKKMLFQTKDFVRYTSALCSKCECVKAMGPDSICQHQAITSCTLVQHTQKDNKDKTNMYPGSAGFPCCKASHTSHRVSKKGKRPILSRRSRQPDELWRFL